MKFAIQRRFVAKFCRIACRPWCGGCGVCRQCCIRGALRVFTSHSAERNLYVYFISERFNRSPSSKRCSLFQSAVRAGLRRLVSARSPPPAPRTEQTRIRCATRCPCRGKGIGRVRFVASSGRKECGSGPRPARSRGATSCGGGGGACRACRPCLRTCPWRRLRRRGDGGGGGRAFPPCPRSCLWPRRRRRGGGGSSWS